MTGKKVHNIRRARKTVLDPRECSSPEKFLTISLAPNSPPQAQ